MLLKLKNIIVFTIYQLFKGMAMAHCDDAPCLCVPHFLLHGMIMSRRPNRPNRSRRPFRAVWVFQGREDQRNELVASIAILAIVALSFRTIAKTVPRAKRVPIRKLRLPAWYCLRRNSNLYDIFLFRKANCRGTNPRPTFDVWAHNLSSEATQGKGQCGDR